MYSLFHEIPLELLQRSQSDEDINIIVGENGSGKSSLLNRLALDHSTRSPNVIAIANTIYDKFQKSRNIRIQRASRGKSIASKSIKEALINLADSDFRRMRNVANTLNYVGFDPFISFELKGLKPDFENTLISSSLGNSEKNDIHHFLDTYLRERRSTGLVRVDFRNNTFISIKNSSIITLFLYEKELRRLKIVSSINVFLVKNGREIPILEASSGELTLISSLVYITAVITERCVILIDEPENSLHPKWQTEYVRRIMELFYFYQPKIIIATHSPLVLNGAEISSVNINVFKGKNGKFELHVNGTTNVEEIYEDFFDIITPENRYISEKIIDNVNLLSEKKITESDFEKIIGEMKESSYDDKQKSALEGIIQLGKEVSKELM